MPATQKLYALKTVSIKDILFARGNEIKPDELELTAKEVKKLIDQEVVSKEAPGA